MPSSTMERRSSGSITPLSASVTCTLVGRATTPILTKGPPTSIDRRDGRSIGEERLLFCSRGLRRADPSGTPPLGRPGLRVLDERRDPLLNGALRLLQALLGLRTVLLDRGLEPTPALSHLALEAVPRLARTSASLAPRGRATPLELVELALDLGAEALQLALGGLALRERLDDLVDAVGDRQNDADGNVDGPLGGLPRVGDAAVADLGQALADLLGVRAAGALGRTRRAPALRRVGGGAVGCHLSFPIPSVGLETLIPYF